MVLTTRKYVDIHDCMNQKGNGISSDTPLTCIITLPPYVKHNYLFQYFNGGFNFGSDVAPRVGSSFTPTDYCPFASPFSVSYA